MNLVTAFYSEVTLCATATVVVAFSLSVAIVALSSHTVVVDRDGHNPYNPLDAPEAHGPPRSTFSFAWSTVNSAGQAIH